MYNMISSLLSKVLTDALNNKTEKELQKGKEKRIVEMPRVLRIFMYVITPIIFGISSLGFIFLLDTTPTLAGRIMIIIICTVLPIMCVLYLFQSGISITYDDTEIEVTTFWFRKHHYNVLDIQKARSNLYFYIVTFSDGFVILTDNMTASSEFYNFAVKHACSIKGKY